MDALNQSNVMVNTLKLIKKNAFDIIYAFDISIYQRILKKKIL